MATVYPTTLPSPSLSGFSATVAMAVIRGSGATDQVQRRVFKSMPHSFSLTFNMTVVDWGLWYSWVLSNGYRWFTLNLPTLYAGLASSNLSPVLLRFTSDLSAVNITGTDVQVTVMAESAPSMIGSYLAAI